MTKCGLSQEWKVCLTFKFQLGQIIILTKRVKKEKKRKENISIDAEKKVLWPNVTPVRDKDSQ